jgi:4-alpha-glucanotransferase
MSDHDLRDLALAAGIAVEWQDVNGRDNTVGPDAMRAILTALELPAGSEAEIRESREKLREGERGLPPLCTAIAGRPVLLGLPGEPGFRLRLESGETREGRARQQDGLCTLPSVKETGYHRLEIAGQETILAVCPQRCHGIAPGTRPWGLAVQLYSPHRKGDGGIGDFTGLSQLADSAARHGADAIAISPVHAQFSADPERFSPYAPSSRLFLNVLHADPATLGADTLRAALSETGLADEFARLEALDLVDWPAASRLRLRLFRAIFDRFAGTAERWRAMPASRRCMPPSMAVTHRSGIGRTGRRNCARRGPPASPASRKSMSERSPSTPSCNGSRIAGWVPPRRASRTRARRSG